MKQRPKMRRNKPSLRPGEHPLNVIEIEISGTASRTVFTCNNLAIVSRNPVPFRRFLGDQREDLSDASEVPGTYMYRTDEVRLNLTFEELMRVITRSLRPAEFLALKAKCGIFHEIHGDFYSDDGVCLQPKE